MTTKQESTDPRIARTRTVVVEAAIDLASECGIGRATIEAIAERSGVARSTIYRHWDSLPELLHDAMRQTMESTESESTGSIDTGTLRGDLNAIYNELARFMASPTVGHIAVSIFAEARRDPQVAELLKGFSEERRQRVIDIIVRAKTRNEIPDSVDEMAMSLDLAAPVFFRTIVLQETIDADAIAAHVDRWLTHYGYSGR